MSELGQSLRPEGAPDTSGLPPNFGRAAELRRETRCAKMRHRTWKSSKRKSRPKADSRILKREVQTKMLALPFQFAQPDARRANVACKEPNQLFDVDLNDNKRKPYVAMTGTLLVRLALARLPIGFIFEPATSVNLKSHISTNPNSR